MLPEDRVLPLIRFRSSDFPETRQFAAWRELLAMVAQVSLAPVRTPRPAGSGFVAALDGWDFGDVVVTRLTLPGEAAPTRYRGLRRPALDHWCFWLTRTGTGAASERQLRVFSLAAPFDEYVEQRHCIAFCVSRDLVPGLDEALAALGPTLPDRGVAGLLADFVVALAEGLPDMRHDTGAAVVETVRVLLAALVRSTGGTAERRQGDTRQGAARPDTSRREASRQHLPSVTLARVRAMIADNPAGADLSAGRIGRAIGISRSALYRCFESQGGVLAFVQRQRLRLALARLSDRDDTASIASIASSIGYSEMAGFSRAFRREFGVSPSDARGAARAGVPVLATVPDQRDRPAAIMRLFGGRQPVVDGGASRPAPDRDLDGEEES